MDCGSQIFVNNILSDLPSLASFLTDRYLPLNELSCSQISMPNVKKDKEISSRIFGVITRLEGMSCIDTGWRWQMSDNLPVCDAFRLHLRHRRSRTFSACASQNKKPFMAVIPPDDPKYSYRILWGKLRGQYAASLCETLKFLTFRFDDESVCTGQEFIHTIPASFRGRYGHQKSLLGSFWGAWPCTTGSMWFRRLWSRRALDMTTFGRGLWPLVYRNGFWVHPFDQAENIVVAHVAPESFPL